MVKHKLFGACALGRRHELSRHTELLTTAPARCFGQARELGLVAKGTVADLVILVDDAARDVTAYAPPLYTIRNGKIVYRQHP